MPITKTGKRSYEINPSEALIKLLRYEQEQLAKNKNVIYEEAFLPEWIYRKCPSCFIIMKKINEIFKCKTCGIIKVPVGVKYRQEDEN